MAESPRVDTAAPSLPVLRYLLHMADDEQSGSSWSRADLVALLDRQAEALRRVDNPQQVWQELFRLFTEVSISPDGFGVGAAIRRQDYFQHLLEERSLRAEEALTVSKATGEFVSPAELESAAPLAPSDSRPTLTAERLIYLLVAIWVLAIIVPAAQLDQSPETQAYLNTVYATTGLVLAITWRMKDNHKR